LLKQEKTVCICECYKDLLAELVANKSMVRRNKALAILLFPIATLMLIVGWTLYFFGSNNRINKADGSTEKKMQSKLTFGVFLPEEQLLERKTGLKQTTFANCISTIVFKYKHGYNG